VSWFLPQYHLVTSIGGFKMPSRHRFFQPSSRGYVMASCQNKERYLGWKLCEKGGKSKWLQDLYKKSQESLNRGWGKLWQMHYHSESYLLCEMSWLWKLLNIVIYQRRKSFVVWYVTERGNFKSRDMKMFFKNLKSWCVTVKVNFNVMWCITPKIKFDVIHHNRRKF